MKKTKITLRQKQILIGKLLGDAHLETINKGKTFRFKFEHSLKQKEYVDWLYKEVKDFASSEPKIRERFYQGKIYKKYWFNTISSGSFRFYYHQFYDNNKKVVPKLIHKWLTPLCLAVWFMDDGSIKSKECRAKILNTQSFSLEDLKLLQKAMENNFQIKTILRKQKEGLQIYIPAQEVEKFQNIIGDYVIKEMRYKLD